jgi:hypothetical protein
MGIQPGHIHKPGKIGELIISLNVFWFLISRQGLSPGLER